MPSKARVVSIFGHYKMALWFAVICTLLLSLLSSVEKLRVNIEDTAFAVATKRIHDRANLYKQQWVLSGQPEQLTIDGHAVNFSSNGWVKPTNGDEFDLCLSWFWVLYPERVVIDETPSSVENFSELNSYRCDYVFSQGKRIRIELVEGKFSIDIIDR